MQRSLFLAKFLRKTKIIQNGLLRFVSFALRKKLSNSVFKIPVIRNMGWNNIFDNEPWMNQVLEKIVSQRGGIFLDIGANIGQTLLKIKSISSSVEYYGFEVNPACLFYLSELIKLNEFQSSFIIPSGLSDKPGLTSLHYFSGNSDDATASIIEQVRPDAKVFKKEYVSLTRLDDLDKIFQNNIGIIKIDVEGAELEVVNGSTATINKHRPVILIEILPAYSSANTGRINRQIELEQLLVSLDYKIFQIEKDTKNNFKSIKYLKNIGINTNIIDRDYILFPAENILKL